MKIAEQEKVMQKINLSCLITKSIASKINLHEKYHNSMNINRVESCRMGHPLYF